MCIDWSRWQEAINAELQNLENVCTWDVVECPNGVNIVGCKWVFKIKCTATGEIEKYKAQLVAKVLSPGLLWTIPVKSRMRYKGVR